MSVDPQSVGANTSSVTITAEVTDESEDPLASRDISYSTNLGTLSASSGTTDGSGQTTFTITSAIPGTATIRATAEGGAFGETTVTFTNSAPVIIEGETEAVSMSEGGAPNAFDLTLHAQDANSHTITWFVATPAGHGVVRASGTGVSKAVGYTPDADFVGSDSFELEARDAFGGKDSITINVNVTASPDTDGDGLTDAEESQLGTDRNKSDTDGDGVSDTQEQADGTNPLDRGSALNSYDTRVCGTWNSNIPNVFNVFELTNQGNVSLALDTKMYNSSGQRVGKVSSTLKALRQSDIPIHDLPSKWPGENGTICSSYDGDPSSLDGRVTHYRLENGATWSDGDFEYAFAHEGSRGVLGKQFVLWNTITPSYGSTAALDNVAQWIEITNLETSDQTGKVVIYEANGTKLSQVSHTIPSKGTKSIPVHSYGISKRGLAIWSPDDVQKKFVVQSVRYVYSGAMTNNVFRTAVALGAAVGSGEQLVASADNRSNSVFLELANARALESSTVVSIHEDDGERLSRITYALAPFETKHISLDSFLQGKRGIVVVDSDTAEGAVASVLHYSFESNKAVRSVFASRLLEPIGLSIIGAFNTFLGQRCVLRMSNVKLSPKTATLIVRGQTGQSISNETVTIPAKGLTEVDICAMAPTDSYGTVQVSSDSELGLAGELIRIASDKRYRFVTPLRP